MAPSGNSVRSMGAAVAFAVLLVAAALRAHAQTSGQVTVDPGDFQRGLAAFSAGDHPMALRLLQPFAARGDGNAQFFVGNIYESGKAMPVNYAEAARWYQRAAEQGQSEAMFQLGVFYINGTGVTRNEAVGIQWVQRAASTGQESARCYYAWALAEGKFGLARNVAQGMAILRKGSEEGSAECEARLGVIYFYGTSGQARPADGVALMRRAFEKDRNYVAGVLGVAAETGKGTPKNLQEAVQWYRKAGAGYRVNLAEILIAGPENIRDQKEGMAVLEQAIAAGDEMAAFNLGFYYERGKGLPRDFAKALQSYRRAAELGSLDAMNQIGVMYEHGTAVPQSIVAAAAFSPASAPELVEARRWYERAASQGDSNGMLNLGLCYHRGRGVERNPVLAFRWLQHAFRRLPPDYGDRARLESMLADLRRTVGAATVRQVESEIENWRPTRK